MTTPLSMTFKTKAEWLDARRRLITASDSRALLGMGYANESPMTVWESKVVGTSGYNEGDIGLQIGLLMEEPMREICCLLTGVKPKKDQTYRIRLHHEHPWMGATLDAWLYEDKQLIPYEFKDVGSYHADEWANDQVPVKVQIQVQHQIAVCGAPHAMVMGWIKGQRVPQLRKVPRNDEFIAALIPRLREFFELVERHQPPNVDNTIATSQALFRMHPDDNGLAILLPDKMAALAEALLKTKERIKQLESDKREFENVIKLMLGHHTAGVLPDGTGFSWKTQERKEHVVKASKSRVLRTFKKLPKGMTYDESAPTPAIGGPDAGAISRASSEQKLIEVDRRTGSSDASGPDPGVVDGSGPVPRSTFDRDAG